MRIDGQVEEKDLINTHRVELQCKLILYPVTPHLRETRQTLQALRKASFWSLQWLGHQSS